MGLAYKAGSREGPALLWVILLDPGLWPWSRGALQQVKHRHGGLTDMHASRVNAPRRLGALERHMSENGGGRIELGRLKSEETLSLRLR